MKAKPTGLFNPKRILRAHVRLTMEDRRTIALIYEQMEDRLESAKFTASSWESIARRCIERLPISRDCKGNPISPNRSSHRK